MFPVPTLPELKFENKDLSKSNSTELEEGESFFFFLSFASLHFRASSLTEVVIVLCLASIPLESKESQNQRNCCWVALHIVASSLIS